MKIVIGVVAAIAAIAGLIGLLVYLHLKSPCHYVCTKYETYYYTAFVMVGEVSVPTQQSAQRCIEGYYKQNERVAERCDKLPPQTFEDL